MSASASHWSDAARLPPSSRAKFSVATRAAQAPDHRESPAKLREVSSLRTESQHNLRGEKRDRGTQKLD